MLKRLYFCEVSIVFLKKGHTDLLHPCRNLVLVVAMTQSYHGTFVVFGNVFGLIVQHMSLITLKLRISWTSWSLFWIFSNPHMFKK